MGAFDWLAQGVAPVQLPDPMQMAARGMTLANLARQNRMDAAKEQAYNDSQADQQAAAAVFADAQQMGWDQALKKHAQINPRGAQLALKIRREDEGAQVDLDVKRSSATKNYAEADDKAFQQRVKAMNDIGSIADEELRNPNNLSISRLQSAAKFYGVNLPPPAEGEDVPGYLRQLRAQAYNIKDRMAQEEAVRHNTATEGLTAAGQAETARAHRVSESIAGGHLALARDKEKYAREQGPGLEKAPSGFRWRPDGSLEAIPGGPADKKQDAGMRKESAELQAEWNAIDDAIAKAKKAPGGFGAIRGAASEAGPLVESMASRYAQSDENAARSAVYNTVSSVIKQRAGTAQSKQEQANILRFMPGPYADVKEIEDKFNAYKDYIKARAPAYGAEIKGGGSSGASGGWGKVERVGG